LKRFRASLFATERETAGGASICIVMLAYEQLSGAASSLTLLIVGVIVLDIGVQSGLASNETRPFAVDPKAQGRINSLSMTATFFGGAIGVTVSGWLMRRYGWTGIVAFYRAGHSRHCHSLDRRAARNCGRGPGKSG
jgi:MFS family permease